MIISGKELKEKGLTYYKINQLVKEGILRKLRNSQEESPFEHRRRRILNDKKYEGSKGQKNG